MKHLVVLTGAGMSAESGISTFRDSGCGISKSGIPCGTLERKCPKLIDVKKLCIFIAVAEGAGGRDHGVVQLYSA